MIAIPTKGTKFRSLCKTISWRIVASLATAVIVYIFTKKIVIAATVVVVEVIAKMILYYLHERLWNRI